MAGRVTVDGLRGDGGWVERRGLYRFFAMLDYGVRAGVTEIDECVREGLID